MTYLRIVPVRRMPSTRPWLVYSTVLPATQIHPGQLVTIPLRGQNIQGIIWDFEQESPTFVVQPIIAVITSQPIMSDWQRQMAETLSQQGNCTLADVVYAMLRDVVTKTTTDIIPTTNSVPPAEPSPWLWYRQRSDAQRFIRDWIMQNPAHQRCIIVPTITDAEQLTNKLQEHGLNVVNLCTIQAKRTYRQLYTQILRGESVIVLGTWTVLYLPFQSTVVMLVDQVEHHAYKQFAQHPRYYIPDVLRHRRQPFVATTPAPRIIDVQSRTNWQPTGAPGPRILTDLRQPKSTIWLPLDTEELIQQTLGRHQRVLCFVPQRGFASSVICRACQFVLPCPSCQRPVRIIVGQQAEAECRACAHRFSMPTTCPRCQSAAWHWQGLGAERAAEFMQQHFPQASVAPTFVPGLDTDITIAGYSDYIQIPTITDLGLIVFLHADSLLAIPDFSISERAWQFLARVGSLSAAPVIAQTFEPLLPFWQRWRHADDQAWYRSELEQRQSLRLPPFVEQWIVRLRGTTATFTVGVEAFRHRHPTVDIQVLPDRPNGVHRLLITWPMTTTTTTDDLNEIFPTPWQIDRTPQSWLD